MKIAKKVIVSDATTHDCSAILDMQIENHRSYATDHQAGYVTLLTPLHYLQGIHREKRRLLIARHAEGQFAGHPAGYLISVTPKLAKGNPFLAQLEKTIRRNGHRNFLMVAQIGVARMHAGTHSGIGTQLYHHFFKKVAPYSGCESVITEVSTANKPSLLFHKKAGFEELKKYTDAYGSEMILIGKAI